MIKLLNKYLVVEWWIPILFFGISIFLFLSDVILSNTDFGLYILLLSGIILFISTIWQLFNGKKLVALLQFSILIIPILFFGFMLVVFARMMNKPNSKLTLESIELLINEKTDLTVPKNFEIMENLIEHTEGGFDSDYSIGLKIKYQESDEQNVTKQIHNGMKSKSQKGLWIPNESGFDFEYSQNENNRAEPFYFTVDTLGNTIEFNLIHL